MNHIFDGGRCRFCNINDLDAFLCGPEKCPERDGTPFVYTTSTPERPPWRSEQPDHPGDIPPGAALTVTVKDPRFLPAAPLCPCCGSGYPVCSDRGFTHAETCARYTFSENLCPPCTQLMFGQAQPDGGL